MTREEIRIGELKRLIEEYQIRLRAVEDLENLMTSADNEIQVLKDRYKGQIQLLNRMLLID